MAAIGLAIFTTNGVAGPLILLKRAFEAVKEGDLEHRIKFRRHDGRYKILEEAFNEMKVALRERVRSLRADGEAEEARTGD